MRPVNAVTHHHHFYLKAVYGMGKFINLLNTPDQVKVGERYIQFDEPTGRFAVFQKSDRPCLVGKFKNIMSAMFYAKKESP